MPHKPPTFPLPVHRLELDLPDGKPVLNKAEAQAEAERCLYCYDAPCIKACPTEIDIPTFIKKIATDNVRGSARTILEANILGYSCARVCPVEELCVGSCVYNEWHRPPIQIGKLQRFATEQQLTQELQGASPLFQAGAPSGKRVALVGAGPASLACAAYLRMEGVETVVFERNTLPGGLNTTGVAPYKLHAQDSLLEVAWLQRLGLELRTGITIGKDLSAEDLLGQFDAVFLGAGLGADTLLKVPGADGPGVVGATAFIEQLKNAADFTLVGIDRALVVGGGNTAIDVVRELALLGIRDVTMVYRRGEKDMSGYAHELEAARKEGAKAVFHATPVAVQRKPGGALQGLEVSIQQSGANAGSQLLPADLIVLAIGQAKLPELAKLFPGIEVDSKGCIRVEPASRRTGNPKVWAGGDGINGGKEVVNAAADGREAARSMLAQFRSS